MSIERLTANELLPNEQLIPDPRLQNLGGFSVACQVSVVYKRTPYITNAFRPLPIHILIIRKSSTYFFL